MNTPIKQHIKKLSNAIDVVLNANTLSNYMNGLIDGGEWSSVDPDFNKLVHDWELTPRLLQYYIETADYWASQFYLKFPVYRREWKKSNPWDADLSYRNPWQHVLDNLETLRYFYR
jgi:hypothetical protein